MKTLKEQIEVMQGYLDGKKLECCEIDSKNWSGIIAPIWNWSNYDYRIKSEPKFRPWTSAEVPIGARIRLKNSKDYVYLILEVNNKHIKYGQNHMDTNLTLSTDYEYSIDNGKTWQPCGILE